MIGIAEELGIDGEFVPSIRKLCVEGSGFERRRCSIDQSPDRAAAHHPRVPPNIRSVRSTPGAFRAVASSGQQARSSGRDGGATRSRSHPRRPAVAPRVQQDQGHRFGEGVLEPTRLLAVGQPKAKATPSTRRSWTRGASRTTEVATRGPHRGPRPFSSTPVRACRRCTIAAPTWTTGRGLASSRDHR